MTEAPLASAKRALTSEKIPLTRSNVHNKKIEPPFNGG